MNSFYDEDPKWLKGNVKDLAKMGVNTIVAVDGAYAMYPGGSPRSPDKCIDVLYQTCRSYDVALLLYQPDVVWLGNEVEKRQTMLDLAWTLAEDGDWFVVWDCDYELIKEPQDPEDPSESYYLPAYLKYVDQDFATVSFTESTQGNAWHLMQMLIRAQPVIMDGNHHTYKLADGRRSQILRRPVQNMADAADLGSIKIRHRNFARPSSRRESQARFYEERDRLGLES